MWPFTKRDSIQRTRAIALINQAYQCGQHHDPIPDTSGMRPQTKARIKQAYALGSAIGVLTFEDIMSDACWARRMEYLHTVDNLVLEEYQ